MHNQEAEFLETQLAICAKFETKYTSSPFEKLIGVAVSSFDTFEMPVNGLRHPDQSHNGINWYIWAGRYSEADDFFKPVHIYHLLEVCPKAIRYLGLPPGGGFYSIISMRMFGSMKIF
jgi:hypothetical protein